MGSNTDDLKGRAKEAAGAATDDDELRNEGKADQAGAKVKNMANDAVDKVKGVVNKD
ncbi:MAG: CsbD family protein [Acidimicrobiia bacterium]|nr:CsbD family protein [Acidimicrobiia bacterium]